MLHKMQDSKGARRVAAPVNFNAGKRIMAPAIDNDTLAQVCTVDGKEGVLTTKISKRLSADHDDDSEFTSDVDVFAVDLEKEIERRRKASPGSSSYDMQLRKLKQQVQRIRAGRQQATHQTSEDTARDDSMSAGQDGSSFPSQQSRFASENKWKDEAERSLLLGEELRKLILEKDSHLSVLQAELETVLGSNVVLRGEVKRLEAEAARLRSITAELEEKVNSGIGNARLLTRTNDGISLELELSRRKVESLSLQLDEQRKALLDAVEMAREERSAELLNAMMEKQELESRLDRTNTLLQAEREIQLANTSENVQLAKALQSAESQIAQLKEDVLQELNGQQEDEINFLRLDSQLRDRESQIVKLESELATQQAATKAAEMLACRCQQVQESTEHAELYEREKAASASRIQELDMERKELRRRIGCMIEEHSLHKAEFHSLQSQLEEALKALVKSREEYQDVASKYDDGCQQREKLKVELDAERTHTAKALHAWGIEKDGILVTHNGQVERLTGEIQRVTAMAQEERHAHKELSSRHEQLVLTLKEQMSVHATRADHAERERDIRGVELMQLEGKLKEALLRIDQEYEERQIETEKCNLLQSEFKRMEDESESLKDIMEEGRTRQRELRELLDAELSLRGAAEQALLLKDVQLEECKQNVHVLEKKLDDALYKINSITAELEKAVDNARANEDMLRNQISCMHGTLASVSESESKEVLSLRKRLCEQEQREEASIRQEELLSCSMVTIGTIVDLIQQVFEQLQLGMQINMQEQTEQLRRSHAHYQDCVQALKYAEEQNQEHVETAERTQAEKMRLEVLFLAMEDQLRKEMEVALDKCRSLEGQVHEEQRMRVEAQRCSDLHNLELEDMLEQEAQLRSAMEATLTATLSTKVEKDIEDKAHDGWNCTSPTDRPFPCCRIQSESGITWMSNVAVDGTPDAKNAHGGMEQSFWSNSSRDLEQRLIQAEKERDQAVAEATLCAQELQELRAESRDHSQHEDTLREILHEMASIEGQLSAGRESKRNQRIASASDSTDDTKSEVSSQCSNDSLVQENPCRTQFVASNQGRSPIEKLKEALVAGITTRGSRIDLDDDSSSELSF